MSFSEDCQIAAAALAQYGAEARSRQVRVIDQPPMAALAGRLDLTRLMAEGGLEGERLADFLKHYLGAATRLHHPAYMAHQVAVPHPTAAVAALIDAYTNNAMAIYEMGPAAATIELAVLNWMLGKVGWHAAPVPGAGSDATDHGAGVLTHGGSLANLTALLAARARIAPAAWQEGTPANLVIIAPPACHYSIARAAAILGLGQRALRPAPIDHEERLDPSRLGALIDDIRAGGQEVLCVVANACATASGLYDPLRPTAQLCRDRGVWLHVDGAHGASALLSERHRVLLDGVALADSLLWDAHKMLRTPTLCAALLVRDHRHLDQAFHEQASYLFHDKDQPGLDFIHRTVECTKAGLGLKAFFALAAQGEQAMAAFIDRQTDLATQAAAFLRAQPDIAVAVEPESNIVCFRLGDDDAHQLALRKALIAAGRHYISTTEYQGRRWLRLALMNPATELSDIAALVAALRRLPGPQARSL